MLCWVGAVLVAVREVLGATVGSLRAVFGAVSGGCPLGCYFGKAELITQAGISNKLGGCKSETQSKATVG